MSSDDVMEAEEFIADHDRVQALPRATVLTWVCLVVGFAGFALLDRQRLIAQSFGLLLVWGLVVGYLLDGETVAFSVLTSSLGAFLFALGVGLRTVAADG